MKKCDFHYSKFISMIKLLKDNENRVHQEKEKNQDPTWKCTKGNTDPDTFTQYN